MGIKKIITLMLAVTFVVALFSGCKKEFAASTGKGNYGNTYPIKSDSKLTYWVEFLNQSQSGVTNFADLPFYQELKNRTGINVEFIHPSSPEQFNLMLASGEYPDIMEVDFYNHPGGPNKAIEDGYIIPLNDAIEKFAPNLSKIYKESPAIEKMAKTDDGTLYNFPFIRGDKTLIVYMGLMLRQDWLDELNLQVPETIDEWHNVLAEFKAKKNATAPLSFLLSSLRSGAAFMGAYDVREGLYVDNGVVKYGQMQPQYKEFLTTFRKWYAEGLIDKNVATLDSKILNANVLDNKCGAMLGNVGGGMGNWLKASAKVNPNFKLVAAPYPSLVKGEKVRFSQWDNMVQSGGSPAISTQCKDIELATRLLDYGYSEEGHMLFNFGTEGVSYNMINGYPTYTDMITNNPDGKSFIDMIYTYCRPNGNGPFVHDPRYMEQNANLPEQKNALKVWSDTRAEETLMPRITLTPDESSEVARIKSDLDTYVNESFMGFLMGTKPLDDFDAFVSQLKTIGVEKLVGVYQKAYNRYKER